MSHASIHTWTKRIPQGTTDRLQDEIRAAAAESEWDAVDRYAQGLPPVERSLPAHVMEAQRRKPINHRLHITLCVLTGGLWLLVYLPRRRAAARRQSAARLIPPTRLPIREDGARSR